MLNKSDKVDRFLQSLEHPRKEEIERVRSIILASNDRITEQIKWNAPSFCVDGDDRVTFRLQPGDRFELIFHRGAKVKDTKDFTFEDSTGLIQWVAIDRGMVTFRDLQDIETKQLALATLVNQWIYATT